MQSSTFTIRNRADKKWNLEKQGVRLAEFDTMEEAEAGLARILKPVVRHYNAEGTLI
jgi:hypothetical protein